MFSFQLSTEWRPASWARLFAWNWKCALMSAAARSMAYAIATMRSGHGAARAGLAVVAVEVA